MKRSILLSSLLAGTAVAVVSFASHADAGGLRQTRFDAGTLRPVIAGPATGMSTSYVLDYKITNETKDARKPALRLEVKTLDTKKTHGDVYDAAVSAAVAKEQRAKTAPASTGSLRAADLAGGATASGLANFGNIDPNSDSFQVRVYGLYDPVYRDRFGKAWSENRVVVMTYSRSGDEFDRHLDALTLTSTTEEIEGEVKPVHPEK